MFRRKFGQKKSLKSEFDVTNQDESLIINDSLLSFQIS